MLEAADSFSLSVVTLLRTLPMARLGLLVYLCFLHSVVFYAVFFSAGGNSNGRTALRGTLTSDPSALLP